MKIYYVALTTNKDIVAKNYSGKRLSLYTKKHEAIKTCVLLNYQWELFFGNGVKEEKPFKVYCVESEPMEVTSDYLFDKVQTATLKRARRLNKFKR